MTSATTLAIDLDRLPDGAAVLVGYSGGLDSTVLLHRLAADLPPARLRALHVHHGLHADADDWARHCVDVGARLGVRVHVVHVAVSRDGGSGPEAAARHARHAAFLAAMRPGEVLALAHHQDDQAETFLLRALRASGVEGLAAMQPWRAHGPGWLWRPLLAQPRAALLAWARQHALDWIEDASNADIDLDRNFLRHRVLPVLRERWPHAGAMFARSAALSGEAARLLEDGDDVALQAAAAGDAATLSVTALRALPAARRARVLRRWIARCGLPPLPAQGVARIEADLLHAAPDADAAFAWAGACVRRWRDLLHAATPAPPLPDGWRQAWDGSAPLELPDGGLLALQGAVGFDGPVTVHARAGGERIVLAGRAHSHALKHVLQEAGVPPWRRERLPLLSDDAGRLLGAGDVLRSADFAQWLDSRGAHLRWVPGGGGVRD